MNIQDILKDIENAREIAHIAAGWLAQIKAEKKAAKKALKALKKNPAKNHYAIQKTQEAIAQADNLAKKARYFVNQFNAQLNETRAKLKIAHSNEVQQVKFLGYSRRLKRVQVAVIDKNGRSYTRYLKHVQGDTFTGTPIRELREFDMVEYQMDANIIK